MEVRLDGPQCADFCAAFPRLGCRSAAGHDEVTTVFQRLRTAFFERMGLNTYVSGDYAKAERWFRRLEALEPDSIRTLRNLGAILMAKGDAAGAGDCLKREERLYGASFLRHCALGDLAYAAGRRAEALKRYKAALADPEAATGESPQRALIEARVAICSEAAAFDRSRKAAAAFAEGEAARRSGDVDEAIRAFLRAAELDPTQWSALNNAGTLLLNEKREPVRAKELFERALEMARLPSVARNVELAEQAIAAASGTSRRQD